MKLTSTASDVGRVIFPSFAAERIYMIPFFKKDGFMAVPERWRPTVAMMMDGVDTDLPAYLMVDQKRLSPLTTHRRAGVHVEGNWVPSLSLHRQPGSNGHRHPEPPTPRDPRPEGHRHPGTNGHMHSGFDYTPELLLLASNVEGCNAYIGEFEGIPSSEGDCSHFDLSHAIKIRMKRNRVYRGSATTLHESIPVQNHCERTVVRINIPGMN